MFNVSSKSIKLCNKVMRKWSLFIFKFFSIKNFSYMLYFEVVLGVHRSKCHRIVSQNSQGDIFNGDLLLVKWWPF